MKKKLPPLHEMTSRMWALLFQHAQDCEERVCDFVEEEAMRFTEGFEPTSREYDFIAKAFERMAIKLRHYAGQPAKNDKAKIHTYWGVNADGKRLTALPHDFTPEQFKAEKPRLLAAYQALAPKAKITFVRVTAFTWKKDS